MMKFQCTWLCLALEVVLAGIHFVLYSTSPWFLWAFYAGVNIFLLIPALMLDYCRNRTRE